MQKKLFEVAFIIPLALRYFPVIRTFLKSVRSRFGPEKLPEIRLYSWLGGNSLGVLLRFNFENFLPSMLKWFTSWTQELGMYVTELSAFEREKREAIIAKYGLTSDLKFYGNFDLEHALKEIERRFYEFHGVRKEPRVAVRLPVRFKSARENDPQIAARLKTRFQNIQEFIQEYTGNISSGGMFVRGWTEIPLRSRLDMVLQLPDSGREFKSVAEVVHIVRKEEENNRGNQTPGFGVQFLEIMNDGRKLIRDYIQRAYQSGSQVH